MAIEIGEAFVHIKAKIDHRSFAREQQKIKRQLAGIERHEVSPDVGLDTDEFDRGHRGVQTKLAAMSQAEADPEVDLQTRTFYRKLAMVVQHVERLDGRKANVRVDVDRRNLAGFRDSMISSIEDSTLRWIKFAAIIPTIVPLIAAVGAGGLAMAGSLTAAFGMLAPALFLIITNLSQKEGMVEKLAAKWDELTKSLQPWVTGAITKAMRIMVHVLEMMKPLFEASARSVDWLMTRIEKAVHGPGFKKLMGFLVKQGPRAFRQLTKIIGNVVAGLAGMFFAFNDQGTGIMEALVEWTAKFREWGQTLKKNPGFRAFIDYLKQTAPKIRKLVGRIAPAIVTVAQALALMAPVWAEVAGSIADFIVKIGPKNVAKLLTLVAGFKLAAGAAGSLGIMAGKLQQVFVRVRGAAKVLFGGLKNLWKIIKLNPFTVLLGVFAAVAGALIVLYNNSKPFRKSVKRLWDALKDLGREIGKTLRPILRDFGIDLEDTGKEAARVTDKIVDFVKTATRWWKRNSPTIRKAIRAIIDTIKDLWGILEGVVKFLTGVFTGNWKAAWNGIKQVLAKSWDLMKEAIDKQLRNIKKNIRNGWEAIEKVAKAAWKAVVRHVRREFEKVKDDAKKILTGARGLYGLIRKWVGDIKDDIDKWFDGVVKTARDAFRKVIDRAKDILTGSRGLYGRVRGWVGNIRDDIGRWFSNVVDRAKRAFDDIIQRARDIFTGTTGLFGRVRSWVGRMRDNIGGWFSNVVNRAAGSFRNIVGRIRSIFTGQSGLFGKVRSWIGRIRDNIGGWVGRIVNKARNAWSRIQGAFKGPINAVIGFVNRGPIKAWNWVARRLGWNVSNPISRLNQGGRVPGAGPDRDSVPAVLTPGEFVINRRAAQSIGLDTLSKLNTLGGKQVQFDGPTSKTSIAAFNRGGNVGHAENVARRMNRKPYVWGGASWGGADCSGFLSMIINALNGKAGPGRLFATGFHTAVRRHGMKPGYDWGSAFNMGVSPPGGPTGRIGHARGRLNKVNVEAGGAHRYVAYGGPARGVPYGSVGYHHGKAGMNPLAGLRKFLSFVPQLIAKIREFQSRGPVHRLMGGVGIKTMQAVKDKALSVITKPIQWITGKLKALGGFLFDKGGLLPPGRSIVDNNTGRPELVTATDVLRREFSRAQSERPPAPTTQNITINLQGVWDFTDPVAARRVTQQLHESLTAYKRENR